MAFRLNTFGISWMTLAALTGCSRGPALEDFDATPFAELRGVSLGMTAAELKVVRPGVAFLAYRGYAETTDGADVVYDFSGNAASEADMRRRARLEYVLWSRSLSSFAEAEAAWRERYAQVQGQRGAPSLCQSIGTGSEKAAWWETDNAYLSLSLRNDTTALGGRVVFGLFAKRAGVRAIQGGTEIPCVGIVG